MGRRKTSQIQGWMYALIALSIGAVSFVLLYTGTRALIHAIGIEVARDSYLQNSFKDTKRHLSSIQNIPTLAALLNEMGISTPMELRNLIGDDDESSSLDTSLVALADLGAAISSRSRNAANIARETLNNSVEFKEQLSRRSLLNEWKAIEVLIDELMNDVELLKRSRTRAQVSEDDLARYRARYLELRANTLNLIRIPLGGEDAPFGFYKSGVLRSLPLLGGINDNLSLEELRDNLKEMGGSASIPQDTHDPKAYFLSSIEEIRNETETFKEALDTQGISLSESSVARKDLNKTLVADEALLISKLHTMFSACTTK